MRQQITPHAEGRANGYPYGMRLCGAPRTGRSSSGPGICQNIAGLGTQHFGYGHCKFHFGNASAHVQAALMERMLAELKASYEALDVSPEDALMQEVQRAAGHVEWLHGELIQYDDISKEPALTILRLYQQERTYLADACKAAVSTGVRKRQVDIAEQQGKLLAGVVQRIFTNMDLTPTQRTDGRRLIAAELRRVSERSQTTGRTATAR